MVFLFIISQAVDLWPSKNFKLLWKPQDPVESSKLSEDRKMITNELIDDYNRVAQQVRIMEASKVLCVRSE